MTRVSYPLLSKKNSPLVVYIGELLRNPMGVPKPNTRRDPSFYRLCPFLPIACQRLADGFEKGTDILYTAVASPEALGELSSLYTTLTCDGNGIGMQRCKHHAVYVVVLLLSSRL